MDLIIATQSDRLADKLRATGVIVIGNDGHPRLDMDRVEVLLDQVDRIIAKDDRRAFIPTMATMTSGPIPAADISHSRPSMAYFELKEECWLLLNRIMIEGRFLEDVVPEGISWTHVAELSEIRNGLRAVNDQLFAEGSFAP